jgi:hypothetical protein
MTTTSSTTGSTYASTTSTNANANTHANNNAPAPPNNMNTDYNETVNVKYDPFDGTEASFYLWTTQILGLAETYSCEQALLGTITVPPASAALSEAEPDEGSF